MFEVVIMESDKDYIGVEFTVSTAEDVFELVNVALKYGKKCTVFTIEEEF